MNDEKMLVDTITGEVQRAPSPYTPVELRQAFERYKAMQAEIDEALEGTILEVGGKPFRTKKFWRAVGRAFRLRLELLGERREDEHGGFCWYVNYRATSPEGDSMVGDGACSSAEFTGNRASQATSHNVRATAHTRAKNRATADLVGFGEVSAEEVTGEHYRAPARVAVIPDLPNGGPGPRMASEAQQKLLKFRLGKHHKSEQDLCQRMNVRSLAELPAQLVDPALEWIEVGESVSTAGGQSREGA